LHPVLRLFSRFCLVDVTGSLQDLLSFLRLLLSLAFAADLARHVMEFMKDTPLIEN
jgi:hypothetical protein